MNEVFVDEVVVVKLVIVDEGAVVVVIVNLVINEVEVVVVIEILSSAFT